MVPDFYLTCHETERGLEIVFCPPAPSETESEESIGLDCHVIVGDASRVKSIVVPWHRLPCRQDNNPHVQSYAYDPEADCLSIDFCSEKGPSQCRKIAYTYPSSSGHDIIFDCTHHDLIHAIEVLFVSATCCVVLKKDQ